MQGRVPILVLFLLFFYALPGYTVVINEIVAANSTVIADADGDFADWLELYNNDSSPVNLAGYFLSDDPNEPEKWRFPDITLSPGNFLLIWCSEKQDVESEIHVSFRLNRDGEIAILSSPAGEVVDSLRFPALPTDVAYGRFPDGSSNIVLLGSPTPGNANKAGNDQVSAAAPDYSTAGGFYNEPLSLELTSPTSDANIHFTLDGSDPTAQSPLYNTAISIDKTTIVRAVAVKSGMAASRVSSTTFFMNMRPALNDLPVLSLVTDPDHLWDEQTGIYENPLESGDAWERPVSVEYFEKMGEPGFSANAGIRIHGGASRLPHKSAKKSFRLYFRSDYGITELEYPIMPSTENTVFDRLVLRAGFNDAWIHWLDLERELTTYVRDPLVRDVYASMGHPASHGDFAHLFLNGEYWGLYNISERYDDDFCDTYIGGGEWDVIKPGPDSDRNAIEAAEGDLEAWNEFDDWFRRNNLARSSAYETLKTYVDIESFIDFYILNIYAQNYDWPRHNWYATRNRDNGRWIFLPWDSEYAFGSGNKGFSYSMNMWDVIDGQTSYPLPLLYSKLRNNTHFRNAVADRFFELLTTQLSQEHVLELLNSRLEQIRSAIPFEAERWGTARLPDEYDYGDWLTASERMKEFIQNRANVLIGQLAAEGFEIPGMALPDGWRQQDIGDAQISGFASFNDGLFTISGSGVDIWNTEDEFYFVWQNVPGDLDVRARVLSLAETDPWAKAGIMIRESLHASSKNVYVAMTPDKVTFQRRSETAGSTVSTKVLDVTTPHWVRLTREGDLFTALESMDGETWRQVDQARFSLRQNAMVGLAVTSHNDGALCTATLDQVTINGITADTAEKMSSPVDFVLLQNYPNPFNPQTAIEFKVPRMQHVKLAVYDITGQEVEVLLNRDMPAGNHTVTFQADDRPSGVYVVKLAAAGQTSTIKMLLVR